jgi:hypothetical protein
VLPKRVVGSAHLPLHCTNCQHPKGSLLRHAGPRAGGHRIDAGYCSGPSIIFASTKG